MDAKTHWERVYETKRADQVSWYRQHLDVSLGLISKALADRDALIVDVGGGEATLVDDLVAAGFPHVDVLDLSEKALQVAKERLGADGISVGWLRGDVTTYAFEPGRYDLWHDRAVFHFLTHPDQRRAYVHQVARAVKPGGHVIVATFGPEGPQQCSGLDVARYDADSLHEQFGARFELVEHQIEEHSTPSGSRQQFVYCMCRI
ncbi:MAG: class I SAM-dependent methyltransferase [Deltaproteobacteria bacterium]